MSRSSIGPKRSWIDKLEIKYGRYAIVDLMKYMTVIYAAGYLLSIIKPEFYTSYLALNFEKIFQGQIWRIFTFMLFPPYLFDSTQALNVIWVIIGLYLYLMIGRALENSWGSFRFNLFYFSGIIFCIIGALLSYLLFGVMSVTGILTMNVFTYVHQTMFLAFAMIYPNVELLLFFVIPVKVKWLGWFYAITMGYELFSGTYNGIKLISNNNPTGYTYLTFSIIMVFSVLNLAIYYFSSSKGVVYNTKNARKRRQYKKKIVKASSNTRHQCEICKKTEDDDPDLEFRYCSKCDGNHEYCTEHLFTHEHIKKFTIKIDKDDL